MIDSSKPLIDRSIGGEFIYKNLNRHLASRYKPDTLFDRSFIPYLVLLFCAVADGAVFYNLFQMLSYDAVFFQIVQVGGLIFGFDAVPVYAAIQLRRLKDKLSHDWFIMWLAAAAFLLAFSVNTALRLIIPPEQGMSDPAQIEETLPGSAQNPKAPAESNQEQEAHGLAMVLFGICMPAITSAGSFFISYNTYDPLKIMAGRLEKDIGLKKDEIRRMDAIIQDFDNQDHRTEMDTQLYNAKKRSYRALAISGSKYAIQKIKEHLAQDAAAISLLSRASCISLLNRLDRTVEALESENPIPEPVPHDPEKELPPAEQPEALDLSDLSDLKELMAETPQPAEPSQSSQVPESSENSSESK